MKVRIEKKYIVELTEKQVIDLKTVLSEFAYSASVPPGMTYSMRESLRDVCEQLDLDSDEEIDDIPF